MTTIQHILTFLLFLLIGSYTHCQTESNILEFEDSHKNTIKILDVISLPRELDTSFFKNSFHGRLFSDSTQNMYINVYSVRRKKRGVYDIRLTIIVKDATVEQIMEQFGYKHFILEYKKNNIIGFNYYQSEI